MTGTLLAHNHDWTIPAVQEYLGDRRRVHRGDPGCYISTVALDPCPPGHEPGSAYRGVRCRLVVESPIDDIGILAGRARRLTHPCWPASRASGTRSEPFAVCRLRRAALREGPGRCITRCPMRALWRRTEAAIGHRPPVGICAHFVRRTRARPLVLAIRLTR